MILSVRISTIHVRTVRMYITISAGLLSHSGENGRYANSSTPNMIAVIITVRQVLNRSVGLYMSGNLTMLPRDISIAFITM